MIFLSKHNLTQNKTIKDDLNVRNNEERFI